MLCSIWILVSQSGNKPVSSALEMQSVNRWIDRKVPSRCFKWYIPFYKRKSLFFNVVTNCFLITLWFLSVNCLIHKFCLLLFVVYTLSLLIHKLKTWNHNHWIAREGLLAISETNVWILERNGFWYSHWKIPHKWSTVGKNLLESFDLSIWWKSKLPNMVFILSN